MKISAIDKIFKQNRITSLAEQSRIRRLFLTTLVMLILCLAGMALTITDMSLLPFISFAALGSGFSFGLLVKGKIRWSLEVHTWVLIPIVIVLNLVGITEFDDYYTFFIVDLLILTDIVLISEGWKRVLLMAIAAYASHKLSPIFALSGAKGIVAIRDQIETTVFFLVYLGMVMVLFNETKKIIFQAEMTSGENMSKVLRIRNLMAKSQENLKIGGELTASSENTLKISNAIEGKLKTIQKEFSEFDNLIGTYSGNSSLAVKETEEMERLNQEQGASISQASAAIEEMGASIQNLNTISQSKEKNLKKLMKNATTGYSRMEEAFDALNEQESSAKEIVELLSFITAVASQTNLLAMNAAIEAAHAGKAGRGFAVVADEIRKLSEQTNENTKLISDSLRKNTKGMARAVKLNDEVKESFDTIQREIKSVGEAIKEIIFSLKELAIGAEEVNRGVSSMVNLSAGAEDSVGNVRRTIETNDKEISNILKLTKKHSGLINEIVGSFGKIVSEAKNVTGIGERSRKALAQLDSDLKKFE